MVRLQPFGNTGHGPVPRRRVGESEQETGSLDDLGMIDDFRLWGSRRCRQSDAPPKNAGGASRWRVLSTTTTLLSQRAEPSPLWMKLCLESRMGRGITSIFRSLCDKAKRGCALRVPLPSGGTARSTRGVLVEGATPPFLLLVHHRRGLTGAYSGAQLTLPSAGSLPPQ